MPLPSLAKLISVVLVSAVAGVMNSIAGGGTLLTFPALVGLGISPIIANATSTVALWPGSISSMWGYRDELSGTMRWALGFAVPSLLGGGAGAWLLLHTTEARFDQIVPWLVFAATVLFMVQPRLVRYVRQHAAAPGGAPAHPAGDPTTTGALPSVVVALWQFAVGIYGGYFGAGAGILMLAVLGFIGLTNIHRMNGLKNWGGLCMNAVAAAAFAFSGLVDWPVALAMAVGSMSGGYLGSRGAQRAPQKYVRMAVIAIGACGGTWLLLRHRL
jgi:uncharacterized membrane protein YfcA